MVNDFILAKKYTLDDCPKEHCEMLYCPDIQGYMYGFWSDFDELIEFCKEHSCDPPQFVWGTSRINMFIDAKQIVEDACEELFDDAIDLVSGEDLKELQNYLDQWCAKQKQTSTYAPNKDVAILITHEDVEKRWGK